MQMMRGRGGGPGQVLPSGTGARSPPAVTVGGAVRQTAVDKISNLAKDRGGVQKSLSDEPKP